MKLDMRPKTATSKPDESLEKRFTRFATALMAVPKKELDRELAKHERKKAKQRPRQA
jgi:hypothetical protein